MAQICVQYLFVDLCCCCCFASLHEFISMNFISAEYEIRVVFKTTPVLVAVTKGWELMPPFLMNYLQLATDKFHGCAPPPHVILIVGHEQGEDLAQG